MKRPVDWLMAEVELFRGYYDTSPLALVYEQERLNSAVYRIGFKGRGEDLSAHDPWLPDTDSQPQRDEVRDYRRVVDDGKQAHG